MSAAAVKKQPRWSERGYDSEREWRRAERYEAGSSHKRRFHDRQDEDLRPVKSRLMLDITAGFYAPISPPAPRFAIGFTITGNLDGKPVSGQITRVVQPPFGETQYVFDFNGDVRTIPENRLDDLIAHLRTAVAAPPTVANMGTVDAAVSGAIVLAQTMAIVPFGFWK